MTRRAVIVLAIFVGSALVAAPPSDGKRWWSYIEFLANDQMKGRDTGSPEHLKAAQYVAEQFRNDGLTAAGIQGFIQPVKFKAWKIVEPQCSIELIRGGKPERLTLGEDAFISRGVEPAESVEAPLVFAGYGLTVPEMKYDDFAGLDVRGKVIVMLGGGPSNIPGPLKAHYQNGLERRRFLARAGVIGTVTIQNPNTADVPWSRTALARFQESMELADPALNPPGSLKMTITVNPAHAAQWLDGSGHTVEELLALATAGKPLPHFPLVPSLRAHAKIQTRELVSQNIVAARPGTDPALKSQYVVLSAHIDHVGVGEPINGDRIYNGAMDNASGVATMLDIARTLHDEKIQTKRALLFVIVTGEEKGLLGSRYFAAHPTVPTKSMVADLNADMFLPLYPLHIVTVYGLKESDLGDTLRKVAQSLDVEVQDDPAPQRNVFIRSDQYSFIRVGVPSLMMDDGFKKGSREEAIEKEWLKTRYHAPSDDLKQPVDLQAAAQYNRLLMKLAETVADDPAPPEWKPDSFFRRFAN
ncbi:MAG TPA: M28 family metallopeptidase [Bryobacteraceae bacterium]|nr:M28 family metallopeptidase [Bryobacteraceae bacterium]